MRVTFSRRPAAGVRSSNRRWNSQSGLSYAKVCDEVAQSPDGGPGYYDECFRRDAKPTFDQAKESVLTAAEELQADVGPQCRRALRAVVLAFESEDELAPEDTLASGVKTCQREAEG